MARTLTPTQIALWQALTKDERQSYRELMRAIGAGTTSTIGYNLLVLERVAFAC